ncbi:tRNA pseudouridine synthase 1 [Tulasnella sp. JGI-2019a]|nr:tRNA pseudouridine synthase 1 [Tulasnella sp. JGI-2019a]
MNIPTTPSGVTAQGTKRPRDAVDEGTSPSANRPNGNNHADPTSSSSLAEPEPKSARLDASSSSAPTRGKGKGRGGKQKPDLPRGKGRPGRGKAYNDGEWGRRTKPDATEGDVNGDQPVAVGDEGADPPVTRLAKRKVALLMSFCGTGCSGMQYQKTGEATIEGYLFDALIKSGAISKDNSDEPSKVDMQRAARTDAGVHAAANLVSLKMITEPPIPDTFQPEDLPSPNTVEDSTADTKPSTHQPAPPSPERVVAWINSFLPPQIRILSFIRTRGSFHARKGCDSRKYEYLFPSWMLLPPKPGSGLGNMVERAHLEAGIPSTNIHHEFWAASSSVDTPDGVIALDLARKRLWRVDPKTLTNFRALVAEFKLTHCFHNYTIGREFSDMQSQRFMMALDVRDPTVLDDGTEWISVSIHGQSFMLHQIRKMIGMAILACRTGSPPRLIPETFGPRKINAPMAPALGLLLEQPVFQTYNDLVTKENAALLKKAGLTPEDIASRVRPPIEFGGHQTQIDAFKARFIYERMREEENAKNIFDRWLRYIDEYDGEDLLYLNPKGIIPPAAVFGKKGERRVKLLKDWIYERRPEKKTGVQQVEDQDQDAEGEDEDAEFVNLKSKELEELEG